MQERRPQAELHASKLLHLLQCKRLLSRANSALSCMLCQQVCMVASMVFKSAAHDLQQAAKSMQLCSLVAQPGRL
jgi:hypothetical protein